MEQNDFQEPVEDENTGKTYDSVLDRVTNKEEKKPTFGKGMILGFLLCAVISLAGFLGYQSYLKKQSGISTNAVKVDSSQKSKNSNDAHYTLTTDENGSTITEREDTDYEAIVDEKMVDKMKYLLKVIDQYYYLTPIEEDEMEERIYAGVLDALGDPYSVYYTKEELNDLMQDTSGVYYGIGAYVSLDSKTTLPKISGVIAGTPAEEAGLRSDDIICEVDGTDVYGYELSDAVALIRGEEGTQVTLKIMREGEMDYLEFVVTRAKVESPTVNYKDLGDGIAYIQITQFDSITVKQFDEAVAEAQANGMKKMVLDLRDNPGGSLSAVVDIADTILPEGLIVYTEDKQGEREEYCSNADCLEIPMVVLVNGNSASAAEILSGAIKDYDWGTLVGTTTYGKGIVQQIIPFSDGTGIKLTISSYFTPNGTNIHGTGIAPDIELELDKEAYYAEESVDNQLEKAVELLK